MSDRLRDHYDRLPELFQEWLEQAADTSYDEELEHERSKLPAGKEEARDRSDG